MLDCRSTADASIWVREKAEVKPGSRDLVSFKLNQHVQAARKQNRWQARGSEVYDTETGLLWAGQDNGYEINWNDAWAYCQNKGSGWGLPSVSQLQALVQAELPGVNCGVYTCKVSDRFSLSSVAFWSNERNGSSVAWHVYLSYGGRYSDHVVDYDFMRALCVRRP